MRTLLAITFSVLTSGLLAQQNNDIPLSKSGLSINSKLTTDLNKRVPETKNLQLNWRSSHYMYFTYYTVDNTDYMVVYDKSGTYKETLEKRAWDDRAPEILKMEFGNSPYSAYRIITFWEAMQTYDKDYFFELQDQEGKSKYAWSDENGKFSDQPSFAR